MGQFTHGLQTKVAAIISPATLVYANPNVFSTLISPSMSFHSRAAINLIPLKMLETASPSSTSSLMMNKLRTMSQHISQIYVYK